MVIDEKYDQHFLFATSHWELYSKIGGIWTVLRIHLIASS